MFGAEHCLADQATKPGILSIASRSNEHSPTLAFSSFRFQHAQKLKKAPGDIWAFPGTLASFLQTIPLGHLDIEALVHRLILLLLGDDPACAILAIEFIFALNDIDDFQTAELLVFPVGWLEGKSTAPEWAVLVDGAAVVFPEVVATIPILPHHEHSLALTKAGERLRFVVHIDVVAIGIANEFQGIVARSVNNAADVVICEWQYWVLAAVAAARTPKLEILDGFWHGAWLNKSAKGVRASWRARMLEVWSFRPAGRDGRRIPRKAAWAGVLLKDPEKLGEWERGAVRWACCVRHWE